jgi:hypothetical protein
MAKNETGLAAFAGAMLFLFGPCLPHFLVGIVSIPIGRMTRKQASNHLSLTALVLGASIGGFHLTSPMLRQLGQAMNAKGLAEWPRGFAIFYFFAGMIVMALTSMLGAAILFASAPRKETVY